MEALYAIGLEIHFVGVVVLLAVVMFIFTGIVMMAAKHLNFSLANSAMIVVSIVFIILEVKRYKILKHETDIQQEGAFIDYKRKAFRILVIEMALLTVMSSWMLL